MFLNDIHITFMEPCVAEPEKIRLKARLTDDISGVMPYLNTVIKNAIYNRYGPLLSFTRDARLIVLYPESLTMAKAVNQTDALQVLDWLKDLVNRTWENRENITPNYEKKTRPTVPEIYKWLPRTNCQECGEASCLAFAAMMLQGKRQVENCRPLFEPEYTGTRETLAEVMKTV